MQLCHHTDNSSAVTKLHFQSTQRTSTLRVGVFAAVERVTVGLSCQIKIGVITVGLSYCGLWASPFSPCVPCKMDLESRLMDLHRHKNGVQGVKVEWIIA